MKEQTAERMLQKVKNSYSEIAEQFSDTRQHPWPEFEYFKKHLFTKAKIVDLGCGNGRLLNFLLEHFQDQPFEYMGIDNNPFFLKIAQKLHPSHQFLLGEQQKINLSENTADLIFNIAAFHHLPSPKLRLQAIKEMYRVLKPGGKIVLTCWNLWQKKYWTPIFTGYLRALVSMGEYSPNDLFIKWKNGKSALASRYYYAFSNSELAKLFLKNGFQILENFSVVDNQRVKAGQGFNFCFILQKNA